MTSILESTRTYSEWEQVRKAVAQARAEERERAARICTQIAGGLSVNQTQAGNLLLMAAGKIKGEKA